MLIVSQDREVIVNLESVESISREDLTIKAFVASDSVAYYELGTYASEEKAKYEMQCLWSSYANGQRVFLMSKN